jgi:hypothetical protein
LLAALAAAMMLLQRAEPRPALPLRVAQALLAVLLPAVALLAVSKLS